MCVVQIGRTLFKKVCRREGIQHWPNHHGRVPADYVRRNSKHAPPSARPRPRPRPASFNTKRARGDFSAVEPPYQPPPAKRAQTAAAAARGHSPPPPLDVAPGLAGRSLFDVGDEVMIKNPPGVFGHEQTGRIVEEVLDGSQAARVSHTGGQLFRKIGKACSETIGQYQAVLAGYNLSNAQIYGRNKQFEEVRAEPACAKRIASALDSDRSSRGVAVLGRWLARAVTARCTPSRCTTAPSLVSAGPPNSSPATRLRLRRRTVPHHRRTLGGI